MIAPTTTSRLSAPSGTTLVREVVPYGPGLWETLAADWRRLAHSTGVGSAFTSATWVRTWLEVFGDAYRPVGLVWREGDDVVGCALLPSERTRVGPVPLDRAYLNASGCLGALCEHNDLLVEPAHRDPVMRDLVQVVLEAGAHELALIGIREETSERIAELWPTESWGGYLSESPYVALEPIRSEGVDYLMKLSANTRGQVRRSLRAYEERFGPPRVEVAGSGDEATEWFDALVALHEKHWRSKGEHGAFHGSAGAFHQRLIRRCWQEEGPALRTPLVRVSFGDVTIAVLYYLEFRGRINYYQSGLLYHDDRRLRPGLVAHTLAIRHFVEAGASEYDFLGGEPHAVRYKRSLSTHQRLLAFQHFPAPGARTRMVRGLRTVRRLIRPS